MDLQETLEAWQGVLRDIIPLMGESVTASEKDIVGILTQRLYELGEDGTGRKIGDRQPYSERLKEYARMKNEMNPQVGYGNPDLKLTGAFYEGYNLEVVGEQVVIGNSDDKNVYLVNHYGESILELSDDGWYQAWCDYIRDNLIINIAERTGCGIIEV